MLLAPRLLTACLYSSALKYRSEDLVQEEEKMLILNLMFKSQTWGLIVSSHWTCIHWEISGLAWCCWAGAEVNESFEHCTSIILALILVNGQVSKHCVKERYDGRGCAVVGYSSPSYSFPAWTRVLRAVSMASSLSVSLLSPKSSSITFSFLHHHCYSDDLRP